MHPERQHHASASPPSSAGNSWPVSSLFLASASHCGLRSLGASSCSRALKFSVPENPPHLFLEVAHQGARQQLRILHLPKGSNAWHVQHDSHEVGIVRRIPTFSSFLVTGVANRGERLRLASSIGLSSLFPTTETKECAVLERKLRVAAHGQHSVGPSIREIQLTFSRNCCTRGVLQDAFAVQETMRA